MKKHTHRATCQVCGNIQALNNGTLAKHGYTVDFGFFSGTCSGSDQSPIEFSTDLTRATIERLEQRAAAIDLLTLADIDCVSLTVTERRTGARKTHTFKNQTEIDEFALTNTLYRFEKFEKLAVNALFNKQRQARDMRRHNVDLENLIKARHGAEPYPVEDSIERLRESNFAKAGDAYARAEVLKADGWNVRVSRGSRHNRTITLTANRSKVQA